MKNVIVAIILSCSATIAFSQADVNPVFWSFTSKKIEKGVYEVVLTATINRPWHIYSPESHGGLGLPTTIRFTSNPLIKIDKPLAAKGKERQKEEGGVMLKYFENSVSFHQLLWVKESASTILSGTIEYMACTNERCLPPTTRRFSIKLEK
jgi:hypothetical protein